MDKEILEPALELIKNFPVKVPGDKVISIYVKTPNLFYRTRRVFLKFKDSEARDITKDLKEAKVGEVNLVNIYDMMSKIYFIHFQTNNTTFKEDYYVISMANIEGKWQEPITYGSKSPDPQDALGTVIR